MARTNPVFKTAMGTLTFLAKAGDPIAYSYVEALRIPKNSLDPSPLTGKEKMEYNGISVPLLNYVLAIEYRFKTMNQLVFDSGCRNLLDLACGYTPRAVRMGEQGINYVGGDLPIVIQSIAPIAKGFCASFATVSEYRETDVTNPESMRVAADLLDGEIRITSEGLIGYLQRDEAVMLCKNIKNILTRHGGAWMLMDLCYSRLEAAIAAAKGDTVEDVYAFNKQGAELTADTNMNSVMDEGVFLGVLAECGLHARKATFYSDKVELNTERFMTAREREVLHGNLRKLEMLVITSDETKEVPERTATSSMTGSNLTLSGRVLHASLSGRIDSISAPDLLQAYESLAKDGEFDEVKVDAKHLEYISSAGLRVLIMMIKASKDKKMSIDHANETVRGILETTGFGNITQYIK